jgi:ribosomal protein S18 acetylase RimI-like enzyme
MAFDFMAQGPYQDLPVNQAAVHGLVDTVFDHGVVFVAESAMDETVCGMLAAQAYPHPMTGELTVSEIAWWVDPEKRGSSAGIRLLRELEAYAIGIGAKVLQMIAPEDAFVVERMYERMGYVPLETTWQRRLAA